MKGCILSLFISKILGFHHKINSLALFLFLVPVLSFASIPLSEGAVVFDVETRLNITNDGKSDSFTTKKTILKEALIENNIKIEEKDAVIPSLDTNLKGGTVDVTIKSAVPYALNDDGKKSVILSGYSETNDILKQNNVPVYPEDQINTDLINDFYDDFSLGQIISIKRAPVIYINVDGGTKTLRSWLKTINEVLREKNILVGNKDKISIPLESTFTNGAEVTITRVAESEIEEDEVTPFAEKIIEDNNSYVGQVTVKQQGKNGRKKMMYKLISENGALVDKILISATVIEAPQTKIISKGVRPYRAGDLWPQIVSASDKYGVSVSKMYNVMICESGGNPYSVGGGGTYYGLFQYTQNTWSGASASAGYGGASIFDPNAQINVTAWKASRQGWGAWPSCS